MKLGLYVVLAMLAVLAGAEEWRWPDAASVRIDTKVRFIDADRDKTHREAPFREALETEGFYNRPRGAGRYPVRVEQPRGEQPRGEQPHPSPDALRQQASASDGTLDSLQYCRCVATPDCNPHHDSARACGSGMFLCCYKKPFTGGPHKTEVFNEINDERPMLFPGHESIARPFPPPPGGRRGVLAGPGGPTGRVGPVRDGEPAVLVGPDDQSPRPAVLVGPGAYQTQQPGVLVGPVGPTGVIGPVDADKGLLLSPDLPIDPIHPQESAQRGVLVGPGGPTGIIGPQGGYGRRPVLVGPGGPTGFVGPRRPAFGGYYNNGYGRPMGRGLLVGPGGPTGSIGPGRGLLVGPGGPTGMIGPQGYFGK